MLKSVRSLLISLPMLVLLSSQFLFAAEKKCLVMGIIPAEDTREMVKKFTPMKEWMEKEMGRCIELFTATDYTGIVEAMRAKKIDFALFGPFSYVLANERAGAVAFAVGVDKKGRTTYRSVLVAHPEVVKELSIPKPLEGEEGMKTLRLKLEKAGNKYSISFVDPASTSGFAVPRYFMHISGIYPEKAFKRVGFLGTHDAIELGIKNKTIDIGADSDVTYEKLLEGGKISRETNVIIWMSPALPGSPMAYRADLPQETKDLIQKTLTRVPSDVVAGYGNIVGYKPVSDADYKLIKDIKKVLDTIKK